MVPFEVKNESTGWRYDLQSLHCLLLHKVIPWGAVRLGFSFELNFAVASIDVILGGCLRASSALQLTDFCFIVLFLKLFKSVEMVYKTLLYFKLG